MEHPSEPDHVLTQYWHRYGKILRYIVSGGTGAVVNFAVLIFLVEHFHLYPVYASVGAFMVAFGVSFTLQKLWTFQNYDRATAGKQIVAYLAISLMNLGLNTLLMYLLITYTTLWYVVDQFITSALIAVESFFLYRHVVFTPHDGSQNDFV